LLLYVDYVEEGQYFKYQLDTGKAIQRGALAPDIMEELDKVERADLVIFQFPMYWFNFPAILKGWMDRVFVYTHVFGGKFGTYDDARYGVLMPACFCCI